MKKLGFGMMRLPLLPGGTDKDIDKEAAKAMIDAFLAAGFTYFDTAYPYHRGASEKVFGELVADRYDRSAYTVTDKLPVWLLNEPADCEKIFEKQMERTHAQYFDWYLLHALGSQSFAILEKADAFSFMKKMKAEGKIKHIGFSFHGDAATLERLLMEHPEMEMVQLQINYADWDSETVQARKCYDLCVKYGKPVVVMEPVKGGALAKVPEKIGAILKEAAPGATPASLALRFAGTPENVMMVLSGMSNMAQLKENMAVFDDFKPLSEKEAAAVGEAAEAFNDMVEIKCTACRYCTEGCPMNIAIPEHFANYNAAKLYGYVPSMSNYFTSLCDKSGAPSACIGCGQCEAVCPQHLSIIENLAKVDEYFSQK